MAERARHILDGDATGGGHRHGTGRPGKTEFPANWTDQKISENVIDVARYPDTAPISQAWNGRWLTRGTRDDVSIAVIVQGELTIELAATLAARNVPVTPAERDELAALLDAMGLPGDPIARLNVQV